MKTLHYILIFLLCTSSISCDFYLFPDQYVDPDVFYNVYSTKYRKPPPNADRGKCYEKYIKSPYKYSCREKDFFADDAKWVDQKFNIVKDKNERIRNRNPLWVEVLCEKNINVEFAMRLNQKLIKAGFLNPVSQPTRRVIDFRTKTALTKYQRYYCLPQGTLNMESLVHLEIF